MPEFPGFIGASHTLWSPNADAERTINLYPEILMAPGAQGQSRVALYGTPGVRPWLQLAGGPIRALYYQDNSGGYAIAGDRLYEFYPNGTSTYRGQVRDDGRPASLCCNGVGGQLFITSGGYGYIFNYNVNTLTTLTGTVAGFPVPNYSTPYTPRGVLMGAYCDGYFLVLRDQANQFQISSLMDGTAWDALDFAAVSTASDDLVAMAVDHREVWLFGSKVTTVWYDSGNAGFPFQPISGTHIEHGIKAPWSVVRLDNSLFWLGADERGSGIVWRAQGYTPQRVSTHAVEHALAECDRIDNAIAWAYQDRGHSFYVLYLPNWETTWVYDVATQRWHERAHWDPELMRWFPHVGRCYCYAWGHHLVGDRQSSTIYEMDQNFLEDKLVLVEESVTTPVTANMQIAVPAGGLGVG